MQAEPHSVAVRLDGVEAAYHGANGERRVLTGVYVELARGELVALLGPNGSGKTTLLRIVAGVLAPTAGRVELFGRPLPAWSRREVARIVAVLPQSTELPDGFSVSEVVQLGRIPHARSTFAADAGDERAVAAALRDADAEDLAERSVRELSGGERQRVLVALALAQEPRLLLLDEPTLHLDLAHQLGLVQLLRRLRTTRDLTVVAVLHDLNLAADLADRVLLLDGGRVVPASREGRRVDPATAERVFGVPIEEAMTPHGRRVLVPEMAAPRDPARPDASARS